MYGHGAVGGATTGFGLVWVMGEHGRTAVFLMGAAIAAGSLVLAMLVPSTPARGNESVRWMRWWSRAPPSTEGLTAPR